MPSKQSSKSEAKAPSRKNAARKRADPLEVSNTDTSQSILGGTNGGFQLSGKEEEGDSSDPPTFEMPFEGKSIIAQRFPLKSSSKPDDTPALIFTHGAGGGIANPATSLFAQGFANKADVLLYQGTMNLQNRVKTFHAVIGSCHGDETALGGRSMGARAAVLSAKDHATKALVLVSYPLVGQNGQLRDDILLDIDNGIDVLFISGDQDHMCKLGQLQKVREKMKANSWLVVVEGADHGMGMKTKTAVDVVRKYTGEVAAEWLEERDEEKTVCALSWNAAEKKVKDSGWKTAGQRKTNSIKDAFAKASKKPEKVEQAEEEHLKKRRKRA